MFGFGNKRNRRTHSVESAEHTIGREHLLRGRAGAVVKINKDFLIATLFGWFSWKLWSIDSSFYGLPLLAAMFGLVAFSSALCALTQIVKLYLRERMIAEYIAQGVKPKTSKLAEGDALDKAGMR